MKIRPAREQLAMVRLRVEPALPMYDGWPWGWGAALVINVDRKKWRCQDCHRRSIYANIYADGTERCAGCAEDWCKATFTSIPIRYTEVIAYDVLAPVDPRRRDPRLADGECSPATEQATA